MNIIPIPSRPIHSGLIQSRLIQSRLIQSRANRRSVFALLPGVFALGVLLAGCASMPSSHGLQQDSENSMTGIDLQILRDGDDLLTAGLGEAGLRSPTSPAFADPANPTRAERRRRAIWSNWRGIADLAPGGGYGEFYGSLAAVPGREYQALRLLPGASQPHRVLLQLPDTFDADKRCLLVSASSGSRGIYGAIALAGAWGLPRGCAVAYTDKGAGTDYYDAASNTGVALDGSRHARGDGTLVFEPAPSDPDSEPLIALQHAHSGDNPEADWGQHVRSAAGFGLEALNLAHPELAPFTEANTRIIAVGVSNGGGAVLRAAELDGDWLDGVVAVSPNVLPGDGGRALYDYASEAALWMPCALLDPRFADLRPGGQAPAAWTARCDSLKTAGLIGATADAPTVATGHLLQGGWTEQTIRVAAMNVQFDLWRAVTVTYASSYLRATYDDMPCGYAFAATNPTGALQAADAAARAAWWSDASGIPPGAGVDIIDNMAATGTADPHFAGLHCLRDLWSTATAQGESLHASVEATRAALPRDGLPVMLIHGAIDGLIPEAFSGGAYAAWAQQAGRDVRYWRVDNAQHFDAFLGYPVYGSQYVPLMPFAYRALDAMWAHIARGEALPPGASIGARRRGLAEGQVPPLTAEHLAIP